MPTPDFTNLNDYFETVRNQFHKNIYSRNWRVNPFITLFPRSEFNTQEGLNPTVITATHELPTAYQFPSGVGGGGEGTVAMQTGTGNTCTPTATTIKSGAKERTFLLETIAFETEIICLTDIQFGFQAAQQVKFKERGLTEYSVVYQSDWYRVHCIGMLNNKVSTSSLKGLSSSSDSNYDFSAFSGVTLPLNELNWIHLAQIYDQLNREGAEEFCSAHADGEPIYALVTGPAYKRSLFQDDEQVRSTVDWNDAGTGKFQNFKARGITRAVNGFLPNVDLFPIRYAADGTTAIYPTTNANTTIGRMHQKNPNYLTVANGGLAVYEVFYVLPREIFEVQVRPIGPMMFGKQAFKPTNYSGEVRWINNPDMGSNKLGNQGIYRMDFQWAAKPQYPELGYAGLTLAKD